MSFDLNACEAMAADAAIPACATHADQINRCMRSLFEVLPVAIWATEGDRVTFANKACARLFGADHRDQLTGQSVYALLDAGAHPLLRQTIAAALDAQGAVLPMRGLIVRADGSRPSVEILITAIPDPVRTRVQMVVSDITSLSNERREQPNSQCALRDVAMRLVDAREDERRTLARELHDELGQRLTALKLELVALDRHSVPRVHPERIRSMTTMLDDTAAAVRRLCMDLRPPMLEDLGLKATIEWLAQEFRRRTGLRVDLHLDLLPDQLPSRVLTTLYRIVQEALTNIAKHAGASRAAITIELKDDRIVLVVDDDGRGFRVAHPVASAGALGLIGIHERVRLLGGTFEAGNGSAGGARLAVSLGLPRFEHWRPCGCAPAYGALP